MDFGYTQEEETFRERLASFLDRELTEEIARQNWEDKGVGPEAREFSLKLAANGFLGLSWPREYGGGAAAKNSKRHSCPESSGEK